jgi:hypothetical protein
MKEDDKMKDISKAVPGGTMPQVGAKQHMKASSGTMPTQASPKVSPGTSTAQASPKVSPGTSPAQASPKTAPGTLPAKISPKTAPEKTVAEKLPEKAVPEASPVQTMQNMTPIQPGPFGVMPTMMHQVPIICCPYLMNLQCPMIYGANLMGMNMMSGAMPFGAGPVSDDMMSYTGGGPAAQVTGGPVAGIPDSTMYPPVGMPDNTMYPLAGLPDNTMYQPYGMGVMPSMNNQYFAADKKGC